MRAASLAIVSIALQVFVVPARAADDLTVERMATCRDSWLDWKKSDATQLKKFGDHLGSILSKEERGASFPPLMNTSVAGLQVVRVFPESVGMGVGFSVLVDAPFGTTRRTVEKMFGKPLAKCESGDNMRTCELEIADKRTFMLMAEENGKAGTSLLGCFYYYEK